MLNMLEAKLQSKKSNQAAFVVLIVLIALIPVVFLWNKNKNVTKNSASENNNSVVNQDSLPTDPKSLNEIVTDTSKDLIVDPKNTDSYIKKSAAEYALGQKEAALKTVEDGLKITPDDELLKSRRDVLLNNWVSDPNQDTPKE